MISKISRRGLFSLIPAFLLPASWLPKKPELVLVKKVHGDGVQRWKHYQCPQTWYDAFTFIGHHGGQIKVGFDGVSGMEIIVINIGEYVCSYQHPCNVIEPKLDATAYYNEFVVPCAIALWRIIYQKEGNNA